MFDEQYNPKPAFWATWSALDEFVTDRNRRTGLLP